MSSPNPAPVPAIAPPALGSTVFHRDGSPPMTVAILTRDAVACEWTLNGHTHRQTFAPTDLTTEDTSAAWHEQRRRHGAF